MAKFLSKLWSDIKEFHEALIIILVPLLMLPLPAAYNFEDGVANYTYVLVIMAVYWVSEALPISVTALLPMVLFPILGVMPSDKISIQYLKDTNFLLLGGFIIAVAFEKSGLHSRLALTVLKYVGPKPRALLFGFMFSAWFLSMWISNTATTTMMMPMVEAVIQELRRGEKIQQEEKEELGLIESGQDNKVVSMDDKNVDNKVHPFEGSLKSRNSRKSVNSIKSDIKSIPSIEKHEDSVSGVQMVANRDEKEDTFVDSDELSITKVALMICVPFGASIGGVATLTGSDTNLILSGTLPTVFPEAPPVSFAGWLIYAFPNSLIMFIFSYTYSAFKNFGRTNSI